MKYAEDVMFLLGLAMIGVGLGAYDWRVGVSVVGAVLVVIPLLGWVRSRESK